MRGLVVPVDVKTRVIVDHHPVARIAQFPRDVRVPEHSRQVDINDFCEMGVVLCDAYEIPDGINHLVQRDRPDARVGKEGATGAVPHLGRL